MYSKIWAAVAVLVLTGCTLFSSPVCDLIDTLSAGVAPILGTKLACKHPEVLKPWLAEKLGKIKIADKPLCEVAAMVKALGPAEILCDPIYAGLEAAGLKQLPVEAECTGSDELKTIFLEACRQIL